jgi:glucose/arabinose dehydrogenase
VRRTLLALPLAASLVAACSALGMSPGKLSQTHPPAATASTHTTTPKVRLVPVASLEQPLAMGVRTGDPALYVAEKTGRIVAIRNGIVDASPVLDLSGQVSLGAEHGLLGLAFSPEGGFLYVDYTDLSGDTRVVEYHMEGGRADPFSRRQVLFVHQPFSNHNGGNLVFGPDGDLYIGLGDGGSGGDPMGNGQSLSTLLGKILRIDPRRQDGRPHLVPPDNPFVGRAGARAEIWDYGLRNSWRFSFDRATGDLWIADVGQSTWEEIDFEPAGSGGGRNFGWNLMEGDHAYIGGRPQPGLVRPVFEYSHRRGGCAVTGGYVYRGRAIPALQGAYVFGDFCLGRLEALRLRDGRVFEHWALGPAVPNLSSFGEDAQGELYAMSLSGDVFRLVPT